MGCLKQLCVSAGRLVLTLVLLGGAVALGLWCVYSGPPAITLGAVPIDWNVTLPEYGFGGVKTVEPNRTVLFDAHSHLTSTMSPRQLVEWHRANGFTAFAVTSHNSVAGINETRALASKLFPGEMVVLGGFEWSSCRAHVGVVGVDEAPPAELLVRCPTDVQIETMVDWVHNRSGLVALNHRVWSRDNLQDRPTLAEVRQWGFDFVEVANQDMFDLQALLEVEATNTENSTMGYWTGTDVHDPTYPVFGWTLLNPTNRTIDGVMAELRAKRTGVLFTAMPPDYAFNFDLAKHRNWRYEALILFEAVGEAVGFFYEYTHGVYSFVHGYCTGPTTTIRWHRIGMAGAWIVGIFVLVEGSLIALRSLWRASCGKDRHRRRKRMGSDDNGTYARVRSSFTDDEAANMRLL